MNKIDTIGVALGNAQYDINTNRWFVKLVLMNPYVYKGVEYKTCILTSTNNHNACRDIVYHDTIKLSGFIEKADKDITILVSKYEGGSLNKVIRAAKKELQLKVS